MKFSSFSKNYDNIFGAILVDAKMSILIGYFVVRKRDSSLNVDEIFSLSLSRFQAQCCVLTGKFSNEFFIVPRL